MPKTFGRLLLAFLLILPAFAMAAPEQAESGDALLARMTAKGPLLLHLPGVGGYLACDRRMLAGLRDAGVAANIVVYDWTDNHPGIDALQAYQRNQRQAKKIAGLLAAHAAADPDSPIYITSHSGGCGLAAWALQDLPPSVKVQTILMMAPALSPTFDLTPALRHIKGNLYVFSSPLDSVALFTGTRLFGTIDGVRTAAAGFGGFVQPPGADPILYRKLAQRPYESDWIKYDDFGGHVGAMSRAFAGAVLAPLIGGNAVSSTQADAPAQSTPVKG